MKQIILCLLIIISNSCHSQDNEISNKIRQNCCASLDIHVSKDDNLYKSLIDKIIANYLEQESDIKYLSNRNNLIQLNEVLNDCRSSEILNDSIKVVLQVKKVDPITIPDLSLEYDSWLKDSLYISTSEIDFIGLTQKVNKSTLLESIKIIWGKKEMLINNSNPLVFNPNMCYTYHSIKRPTAFLSKDGSLLYIYIFGYSTDLDIEKHPNEVYNSYMLKYVISKDEGMIKSIVVPESALRGYNWLCKNFIGF